MSVDILVKGCVGYDTRGVKWLISYLKSDSILGGGSSTESVVCVL